MAKFIAWVSFPIEVEADDEDGAFDVALELVSGSIETCGEISIPSIQEADADEDTDEGEGE